MLGVIHALRDLAELFADPVGIPRKFDEVENDAVLFLPGELRELDGVQLQRREDLREELCRTRLKERSVAHLDRAGRLGRQGLTVDGEAGVGLNDDFALIGAPMHDIITI